MTSEQVIEYAKLALMAAAAYYGFKLYQGGAAVSENVSDALADAYGGLINPAIVNPQIKLQSAYFSDNGDLRPAALDVIKQYTKIYEVAFEGSRIKPEFSFLINSGIALTNADFESGSITLIKAKLLNLTG